MSKRHAFEAALTTNFRWPTKGDKPFAEAAEPLDNALIAEDDFTRLVLMTSGYKKAGDLMVAHAMTNSADRDFLVFPILFNYRHFIELSLKYQLATYGPTVDISPIWNTHDLHPLWSSFLDMLERYGTPDPDEADPVVGEIVIEFAKIDPHSYSYRYPVDRKGSPIAVIQTALDLANLASVVEAVENYFTGCDGYLDHICSASPY